MWMSRNRFDAILSSLSFTNVAPPTFMDKFWEIQQMVEVWGTNMRDNFLPGYMNCLNESMSVWTNKFTCPSFMFVPCKPWLFGNKYHTMCCCSLGIMWGIDLVEEKITHHSWDNNNMKISVQWLDSCFRCCHQSTTRVLWSS